MECSLCCESFEEEGAHVPRILDCGHTFCTICIERLESTAVQRQGPRCPECRQPIRLNRRTAGTLPKNFKLLEVLRERSGNGGHAKRHGGNGPSPRCTSTPSETYAIPAVTRPVEPEVPAPPGIVYVGNYYPHHMITDFNNWRPFETVQRTTPLSLSSLPDDFAQLRIRTVAEETESRNRTSTAYPSTEPTPTPVPNAVASGRAVMTPDGELVCRFFREGTCHYGHRCWFRHPIHHAHKPMCKHWKKGQCRMGLECRFRHGCAPTEQPTRRRLVQDPSAPGPSGEGVAERPLSSTQQHTQRPSTVVLVSGCGSTVQHIRQQVMPGHLSRGNLLSQAEATPNRSFNTDTESHFDNFPTTFPQ